eukprot:scaffold4824_cov145-Isochrysis_galbana.AAC.2
MSPTAPRAAVLQDVVRTMFNPKFILELFRSQELYSVEATRQIFDRLAHSSIMRLNDSSMDKVRAPAGRARAGHYVVWASGLGIKGAPLG